MELWTQDEAIAFEAAKEVIGHMIAIKSSELWNEEQKDIQDLEKISQLKLKRDELVSEQINLRLKNHENIERVIKEYGSLIKAKMDSNL
jgi:hypothetical protein